MLYLIKIIYQSHIKTTVSFKESVHSNMQLLYIRVRFRLYAHITFVPGKKKAILKFVCKIQTHLSLNQLLKRNSALCSNDKGQIKV